MTLHIVTRSSSNNMALSDCLEIADPSDAVLLIADGVYGLLSPLVASSKAAIYALDEDLQARGLCSAHVGHCQQVDYAGMVSLTEQHQSIHTWQ